MQDIKIVAFVGMPGSGKGSCASYINEKYGCPIIHFGNMLYEEVQRRGLDNVKDENFVRSDMREKEGAAVLAKHAASKAEKCFSEGKYKVVMDGLYSWDEYKYLENKFGSQLILIAIAAPKALRRERVLDRKDAHRKYDSIDQLITREITEIENIEKGGPIAYADYTIVNDGTLEQMLSKLEAILKEVKFI